VSSGSAGSAALPRRPHLGWFAVLSGGLAALVALVASGRLHRAWARRLPVPGRRALRALLAATVVVHGTEAVVTHRLARRAGLPDARARAVQALAVGAPALLAARRAAAGQAPDR
jgi:hypothetical protein